MKITTFFLLLTLSFSLSAGEAAKLHLIGFSEDGNYLAFQQYGVTDGEGLAFADTYFVDVDRNEYKTKPIENRGEPDEVETKPAENKDKADETKPAENKDKTDETKPDEATKEKSPEDTVRQDNLKQARNQLEALKIIQGNLGEHVISHVLSDVGVEPLSAQFTLGIPLKGANYKYKTYTIKVGERKGEAECFEVGEAKMLTVTLTNEDQKKTKTLQEDKEVPKTRGCPLRYRIQDVYVYRDEFIVIFLNLFKPGFEGESMRYLVVTGTLN